MRAWRLLRNVALAALVATSACGTSSGGPDATADTSVDTFVADVNGDRSLDAPTMQDVLLADASDVLAMPDGMVGAYPPGPYGNAQGDVLANLSWVGYVNPAGHVVSTMVPYGPTSMQAMRELGRRYALVHVAEFY